jgi:uncharacterized FlaG/YvyC family protein
MVERVDGINQMQNTERINSVSNRETNRNKKNNNRDLLESVKENKLSSDKLKKELEEKIDDMNSIMEHLRKSYLLSYMMILIEL